MDRRALPGLAAGLAGGTFGVVGAMTESKLVAVLAAACSLLAGAAVLVAVQQLRQTERAIVGPTPGDRLDEHGEFVESLIDAATGLPDGQFFEIALHARVAAARRHLWPVSVVLVQLTPHEGQSMATAIGGVCTLLRQTLREADAVCRLGETTFGLLLDDTPEAGAVWATERVQEALSRDPIGIGRLVAGVAAYPSHSLEADGVLRQAQAALGRAAAVAAGTGNGRVEVAAAD